MALWLTWGTAVSKKISSNSGHSIILTFWLISLENVWMPSSQLRIEQCHYFSSAKKALALNNPWRLICNTQTHFSMSSSRCVDSRFTWVSPSVPIGHFSWYDLQTTSSVLFNLMNVSLFLICQHKNLSEKFVGEGQLWVFSLFQQCPSSLVCLICIVCEMAGKWPYIWYFVRYYFQDFFQDST